MMRNMSDYTLSIIIPAYNVGSYIGQCLNSIIRVIPNNDSVEVIVVDDGSTDNTALVLQDYQHIPFISIIAQSNQGVSAARNIGIEKARGRYIGFLDADDYWDFVLWDKLVALIRLDADIIEFNIRRVSKNGDPIDEVNVSNNNDYSLKQLNNALLKKIAVEGQWSFSSRFFNKKIWSSGYRFPEGHYYEDLWLLPQIYANSCNVVSTATNLVCYRKNENSITQVSKIKYAIDVLMAADTFLDLAKQKNTEFYKICARKTYGVALRVASHCETDAMNPNFWCLLYGYRKKAWYLLFTLDVRFIRYFLFPKLSFFFSHKKYIKRKSVLKPQSE